MRAESVEYVEHGPDDERLPVDVPHSGCPFDPLYTCGQCGDLSCSRCKRGCGEFVCLRCKRTVGWCFGCDSGPGLLDPFTGRVFDGMDLCDNCFHKTVRVER